MQRMILSAALIVGLIPAANGAGPLDPPGPPAPTMKTLVEIEPRTPITNSSLPLTIKGPGSYYLAENLLYDGEDHAIFISTPELVTIDLNGFSLRADPKLLETEISAIYSDDPGYVTIRNGFIGGFGGRTIDLNSSSVHIDRLTIEHGSEALWVGSQSSLTNSVVRSSPAPVVLGSGSIIWMGHGALVDSCTFSFDDRGKTAGELNFLRVLDAAIVRNNTFSNMNFNTTSHATVLKGGDGCVIARNVMHRIFRFTEVPGYLYAIEVQFNSVVEKCNLNFIWSSQDLGGIISNGSAHVSDNQLRTLRGGTPATFGISSFGIIERNVIGFFEVVGQDEQRPDIPAAIKGGGVIAENSIESIQTVVPETTAILVQGEANLVRENRIATLQGSTIGIFVPSNRSRLISNSVSGATTSMKITGDKNYYALSMLDSAPQVTGSNVNVIIP